MREMSQGEDYVEDVFDSDTDAEAGEDTGENKIFGVDKKIFVIGLIAFIFIVMVLVVILMFKNRGSSSEQDDDFDIDAWLASQDATQGNTQYEQPVQSTGFSSTVYSSDWNYTYTIDGTSYADGTSVLDTYGNVVGTISTTDGEPLVDYTDRVVCYLVRGSGGNTQQSGGAGGDSDTMVSDDDVVLLRKLGYTGDEISFARNNGISMEHLVEEAEALRDEEAREALIRMSDSASDEFRYIYEQSLVQFGENPYYSVQDIYGDDVILTTGDYIVNADYVKMPTYGLRLYFKVKIANGTYTMMAVSPDLWDKYPESGNIILRVYYKIYGDEVIGVHLYITQIDEVDITNLTVNPEDSGVDLEKAVGLQ